MSRQLIAGIAGLVIVVLGAAMAFWPAGAPDPAQLAQAGTLPDGFVVPEFEGVTRVGRSTFDYYCADCHGEHATGTQNGPPLVHKIYEPGHHGDGAFLVAPLRGVRAHHWQFGNMPPVDGITPEQIEPVIAYVRALQRANGIS